MLTPSLKPAPSPKYWIGEHVMFDRSKLSYAMDEGQKIGVIHTIVIQITDPKAKPSDSGNVPGHWQVLYYTEHDDPVPEECMLGPCVVGEKR